MEKKFYGFFTVDILEVGNKEFLCVKDNIKNEVLRVFNNDEYSKAVKYCDTLNLEYALLSSDIVLRGNHVNVLIGERYYRVNVSKTEVLEDKSIFEGRYVLTIKGKKYLFLEEENLSFILERYNG